MILHRHIILKTSQRYNYFLYEVLCVHFIKKNADTQRAFYRTSYKVKIKTSYNIALRITALHRPFRELAPNDCGICRKCFAYSSKAMCGASPSRVYDERKCRKVSVRQSAECAVTSACAKYKSHSGQDMKKACTSFPKECDAGSCPLRRVLTDTYRWQWLTSKLSVR